MFILLISLTHWLTVTQAQTPEEQALAMIEAAASEGATTLDLSDIGLTALPPEIGQLTHLKRLVLSENKLTELPSEIGQLTALEVLNLSNKSYLDHNNELTTLPTEIGQLTNLKELNLAKNRLDSIGNSRMVGIRRTAPIFSRGSQTASG
ncbi:MAG: hypothetical protein GY841_20685 [FCB group bacterium]|nr:hypothetical protein [FCB group bacterium]